MPNSSYWLLLQPEQQRGNRGEKEKQKYEKIEKSKAHFLNILFLSCDQTSLLLVSLWRLLGFPGTNWTRPTLGVAKVATGCDRAKRFCLSNDY